MSTLVTYTVKPVPNRDGYVFVHGPGLPVPYQTTTFPVEDTESASRVAGISCLAYSRGFLACQENLRNALGIPSAE